MNCPRCLLPLFDGASGLAAAQCRCWAHYSPNLPGERPMTTPWPNAAPLTAEDVRRIVREEFAAASMGKEGA